MLISEEKELTERQVEEVRAIRQWQPTAGAMLFRNQKIRIQSIHKGTGLNQEEKYCWCGRMCK